MEIQIDQATIDLDKKLFQTYLDDYYAKTKDTTGHIKYGTAGFRDHAKNLPHVCLRVGIFTGLVAKLQAEQVLGIVVTASHNKACDNGIKQSDFDGGMIREVLEKQVSSFVVEQDLNKAIADLLVILKGIEGFDINRKGMVFIGRDTRESGPYLSQLMIQGIQSSGSLTKDFGEVTTPMIHWLVRHFNLEEHSYTRETPESELVLAFHNFFLEMDNQFYAHLNTPFVKKDDETIVLDCSNGVGSFQVKQFLENMKDRFNVLPINVGQLEFLNVDCGAEFLHKKQTYPREAKEQIAKLKDIKKVRCLGFDGDADRIVYYLPVEGFEQFILLDGDRIISLFALFFQTIFRDIDNLYQEIRKEGEIIFNEDLTKWEIGMVQTPYANGSSTEYLKNTLKVTTRMSPNGVKNLHPRAHKYDIGIYCESNGHGTFVVSDEKMKALKSIKEIGEVLLAQDGHKEKIVKFVNLLNLAYHFAATQNQIVGDAMTNFLCIEQALTYLNMSAYDWLNLYKDRKCLNSTVVIRDRSKIVVSENQDVILEPKELQDSINEIVAKFPGSRSFARPSGTEDIVRVYVEHECMDVVNEVTKLVSEAVVANKTIN